jgi:hypothetical protein
MVRRVEECPQVTKVCRNAQVGEFDPAFKSAISKARGNIKGLFNA